MGLDRVDELIAAVVEKLKANRDHVRKSLRFGRVTWRVQADNIDIELHLKL